MLLFMRIVAVATLIAIAAIHIKMMRGQPLTPAEQRLWKECCR